ncbi:MAG: tetratricopeptide repeat protein [Thermodesulfobacteriota bacterium]
MPQPARPHLKLVVPGQELPDSVSPGEILNRIQLMKSKGAWDEIIQGLHPLDKRHPQLSEAQERVLILQEIAFALTQKQRFQEAISLLLECHQRDPRNYTVVASLGFNYYNALMCDKAREIRLGSEKARYIEEADRWLALAEELYPASVVDFYRHGMLFHHIQEKKDQMACSFFEKAIANWESLSKEAKQRRHKDHKNYIKALYHLAKALMRLGRYAEAEQAARKCMEEDRSTDHEEPIHKFYLLGRILLEADKLDEALGHLKNAAHMKSLRPKDYIFYTLAVCLVRMERWEEALGWLEKVPAKFRRPHMKRLAGWICYRLGRMDQAGSLLDQALEEDTKGCHLTLVVMGRIFEELGNWNKALECFRQANDFKRKEYMNDHKEALLGEGRCLVELGDLEGAREVFKRVLLLEERNQEAAKALEELGEPEPENSQTEIGYIPF